MRRSPELKGITPTLAHYLHSAVGRKETYLETGGEWELADGLFLRRTNPSVVEGRGDEVYEFWLVYENRAQVPANVLFALANFAMIKS